MKKEIWRFIKNSNNRFQVSNRGKVRSKKRKYVKEDRILTQNAVGLRLYVHLGKGISTSVAKLVLSSFKMSEIDKEYALHIDKNTFNNNSKNLKWGTLGDVKRLSFEIRKKKRGVYFYPSAQKRKWRVVLKVDNKAKTIGYYQTKLNAEIAFMFAYKQEYKRFPY